MQTSGAIHEPFVPDFVANTGIETHRSGFGRCAKSEANQPDRGLTQVDRLVAILDWVVHASRVLAIASRNRGLCLAIISRPLRQRRDCFGETPKVRAGLAYTRDACATQKRL